MIIFVGSSINGETVKEYVEEMGYSFSFIGASDYDLQDEIEEINLYDPHYVIIDLDEFASLPINSFHHTLTGITSPIVFYGIGYESEDPIIKPLKEKGYYLFVTATNATKAKEELYEIIKSNIVVPVDNTSKSNITRMAEKVRREKSHGIKIGVAGAGKRIGATTTAVQIIKHLKRQGYKACYVETNKTNFVLDYQEWEKSIHDKYLGYTSIESVDMYYKQERLADVLRKDYDYYVYDYGNYEDVSFNTTSFLEKDIRIFTVGSKPQEIRKTYEVLASEYFKDNVYFFFNYTPSKNHEDILSAMGSKQSETFFHVYTPDYFDYKENEAYHTILPTTPLMKVEENSPTRFKKLFSKRG